MNTFRQSLTLAALGISLGACNPPSTAPNSEHEKMRPEIAPHASTGAGASSSPSFIALPPGPLQSPMPLEQALRSRRSMRDFQAEPLSMELISQLLWAAQGKTGPSGERTSPSAGALYPLELYVLTHQGVFHYIPEGHGMALHLEGDRRKALHEAALEQEAFRSAPMVMVFTAVFERTFVKYGGERGSRYVYLEAGHAAQNVLLAATALGLGALSVGAFNDQKVRDALQLPLDHFPLYFIVLGRAKP